jgi:hypothetical protein
VIHEDVLKIGRATKAPDYCFRIGSVKKFFVEAKKPSVNLKDDVSPAFQLNLAVQRIIDRIVFLRICEDRGIEDYGRLQNQLDDSGV